MIVIVVRLQLTQEPYLDIAYLSTCHPNFTLIPTSLSLQLHSYPNFTLTPTSLLPQLHSYPNFTPQPHSYPNFTLTLPSRPIKILSLYICMYVYPSSVHTYYIYVCTYMPHHGHWFLLVLHSTGFQCSRPQVVLSCISCSGSLTL